MESIAIQTSAVETLLDWSTLPLSNPLLLFVKSDAEQMDRFATSTVGLED